jgi:hypothetical protein
MPAGYRLTTNRDPSELHLILEKCELNPGILTHRVRRFDIIVPEAWVRSLRKGEGERVVELRFEIDTATRLTPTSGGKDIRRTTIRMQATLPPTSRDFPPPGWIFFFYYISFRIFSFAQAANHSGSPSPSCLQDPTLLTVLHALQLRNHPRTRLLHLCHQGSSCSP